MSDIVETIVAKEWVMFHSTQNEGGTASCQNNRPMFEANRRAQFSAWSVAAQESYLADVERAEAAGENLVTYKYAYMMESTAPAEYLALRDRLPPVSPEKAALVETLVRQMVLWAERFSAQYPYLGGQGRMLHTAEDTPYSTSIETYARGELKTYSLQTLTLLAERFAELQAAGLNYRAIAVEAEMRAFGFASLEAAEARAKALAGE